MRARCCVLLLAANCQGGAPALKSAAVPPSITSLTGEVHLHQFPQGGHAWAGFLSTTKPVEDVDGDQLVLLEPPPTRHEGPCTLTLQPVCAPACSAASLCLAKDSCVGFEPLVYVDAGQVLVTGSAVAPLIRMWFASPEATYNADPPPGPTPLFRGGELLHFDGAQGRFAFAGDLSAPVPMVVTAPVPGSDLHLPASGPMEVTWQQAGGELALLRLQVSGADGGFGQLRCLGPDSGTMTIPADLLAALPQRPRTLHFELERDVERLLPTAQQGVGVLTHATFTAWANGAE